MDKITVETTGQFMLQDVTNGAVIEAEGATEVEKTGFVTAQIERGTLKEVSGKGKPAEITGKDAEDDKPVAGTETFTSSQRDAKKAK